MDASIGRLKVLQKGHTASNQPNTPSFDKVVLPDKLHG